MHSSYPPETTFDKTAAGDLDLWITTFLFIKIVCTSTLIKIKKDILELSSGNCFWQNGCCWPWPLTFWSKKQSQPSCPSRLCLPSLIKVQKDALELSSGNHFWQNGCWWPWPLTFWPKKQSQPSFPSRQYAYQVWSKSKKMHLSYRPETIFDKVAAVTLTKLLTQKAIPTFLSIPTICLPSLIKIQKGALELSSGNHLWWRTDGQTDGQTDIRTDMMTTIPLRPNWPRG